MKNLVWYLFTYSRLILIVGVLIAATIAMVYFFIKWPKEDGEGNGNVVTSDDLLLDVNTEREKEGLHEIPAVNSRSSGTNTYARLDKSFSSVPDFFMKLFGNGRNK